MAGKTWQGKVMFPGEAEGTAVVSERGLSFWGGVDPSSGLVTDVHNPLFGRSITGKVLVSPGGAGSSSGCGVLMEMVRRGTNPAAIINLETEVILALGPLLAQELYGRSFPIIRLDPRDYAQLENGDYLRITEDGRVSRVDHARPRPETGMEQESADDKLHRGR